MRTWTGVLAVLIAGCGMLAGCSASGADADGGSSASPVSTDPGSPADRLAGLVALAADRHYVASYRYTPAGQRPRTVTVTLATDGSWRVDVPRGGLGGGRDITVAGTGSAVYQCGLGDGGSCARVADGHGSVPARYDPRVQRLFVDWLPKLADRDAALSVDTAPRPKDVTGSCFSVEPTAASLSSPVPSGVYCLASDGSVTGATLSLGRLVRVGDPRPAPRSIDLPGPTGHGSAVPTRSPSPSPTPSSRSSSPTPSGT